MTTSDEFPASAEVRAEMEALRRMTDDEFLAAVDELSTAPSIEPGLELASRDDDDILFALAVEWVKRRR